MLLLHSREGEREAAILNASLLSPKGVSPVVDVVVVVVVQVVIVKREGEKVGTHTSKGRPGFLDSLSTTNSESAITPANHRVQAMCSSYIFAAFLGVRALYCTVRTVP